MKNFNLPPYPYDLLNPHREHAQSHEGGAIDLSVGTPCDPPPSAVIAKLSSSNSEKGYPKSVGSDEYLDACRGWLTRRLNITRYTEAIAGCIGTKEFVASVPNDLRLKYQGTVLYPSISYPSYAMGAALAGCRAVPVPVDNQLRLDIAQVDEEDNDSTFMGKFTF